MKKSAKTAVRDGKELLESVKKNTTFHFRRKSRMEEEVRCAQTGRFDTLLYTARVQVRVLGIWVTIWSETCDHSDGDARAYIRNCAEEVRDTLNNGI